MGQFSHRLKNALLSLSPVTLFEGTLKCFLNLEIVFNFHREFQVGMLLESVTLRKTVFCYSFIYIQPSFPGNQHCDVGKRLHHALQTIIHILLLFKSDAFSYICSYCLKISHSFSCHVTAHSSPNL